MSSRSEGTSRISRALTYVLRHHATRLGLHIGPDGFVPLRDVLALGDGAMPQLRGVREEEVRIIVRECPKQRFKLQTALDGTLLIRANQGHSIREGIDDDAMLTRITPEAACNIHAAVHGTYLAAWRGIERSGGLSRMRRRHVHFADLTPIHGGGAASAATSADEVLALRAVAAHVRLAVDAGAHTAAATAIAAAETSDDALGSGDDGMATGMAGGVAPARAPVSGLRTAAEVHVYLDVPALVRDGARVARGQRRHPVRRRG